MLHPTPSPRPRPHLMTRTGCEQGDALLMRQWTAVVPCLHCMIVHQARIWLSASGRDRTCPPKFWASYWLRTNEPALLVCGPCGRSYDPQRRWFEVVLLLDTDVHRRDWLQTASHRLQQSLQLRAKVLILSGWSIYSPSAFPTCPLGYSISCLLPLEPKNFEATMQHVKACLVLIQQSTLSHPWSKISIIINYISHQRFKFSFVLCLIHGTVRPVLVTAGPQKYWYKIVVHQFQSDVPSHFLCCHHDWVLANHWQFL